eukprot:TRINITY_DN21834_c0_g1_i1.p1 TRINITY_DN21834_c0_g1~~TRINITY_DN21834_c0_g1_i1.p1  ORF type:complete len:541 (-),score=91.67 TRINITY_DN21834_c0_g1_i1:52-1674(-)
MGEASMIVKYAVTRCIQTGFARVLLFDTKAEAERNWEMCTGGVAAAIYGPSMEELKYHGLQSSRPVMMNAVKTAKAQQEAAEEADAAASKPAIPPAARQGGYSLDTPPAIAVAAAGGGGGESQQQQPVRCLVVGAGSRGTNYSSHAELKPVAVAEPNQQRRSNFAAQHGIPLNLQFASWEEAIAAFERSAYTAEVCIVTTPDRQHLEPALASCKYFSGLLLEKPMAVSEADCERIVQACRAAGTVCAVCHVLRYTFANKKVRQLIDDNAIGDVLSITHTEPVGHYHFAHSYVRGNWRREEESTSALLAKCCHDVDLIASWMHADPCVRVSSFGSLRHFRRNRKPAEAGDVKRCLDCAVQSTCPYSAPKLYLSPEQSSWSKHLVDTVPDIENIMEALKTGPYGRCVYECDNDVCDNQTVNFQFASGSTANLTMASTSERLCERETKVYGSLGELSTTGPSSVRHVDFRTGEVKEYFAQDAGEVQLKGHGGADQLLVDSFVRAMRKRDKSLVLTGPEESLLSHRLAFAAEQSRRMKTVVELS